MTTLSIYDIDKWCAYRTGTNHPPLIYFKNILSSKILMKKTYYYEIKLIEASFEKKEISIAFKRKIYFWPYTCIFNLEVKILLLINNATKVKKEFTQNIGQSKYKNVYKITKHFINMWSVIRCAFAEYFLALRISIEEKIRSNKAHRCKRNT